MSVCKRGFCSSFISYFIRLSRVLPTSQVFTSGYVNTETILHFFIFTGRTRNSNSFCGVKQKKIRMHTTPSPQECFSVVFRYVQPVLILVNVSTKQITTSKNTAPQRSKVVSGDGNCFHPRALALLNDEIGHEKYEDIPRSSDSLLEKNPKVFVLLLFSSNSLGKKGNITENPAETVGKYIEIRTSVL